MLTASVVIGVFIIFAILAVIVNRNGTVGQEKKNTALNVAAARDEKDSYTDITTIDDGETDTDDEETETAALQDETTKENETERETVDPNTLPYKIMVNRAANCITVYENDGNGNFTTPVKAIVCSTGKEVGNTPLGSFSTLISYKWLRMVDNSYGQYAYRFFGSILFHSVPYFTQDKGDLEWEQFNKLGESASLGCVRVCCADAIWLIDNCQVGTAVEVYDDEENPGPLGKPEMIKIPEDSPYKGWDPTDPDKNNPWNDFRPEIKVEKTSIKIYTHATDVVKALGIKGYDTCGNDVTDMVKITGLDVHREGVYNVRLSLTDLIGREAAEVMVTVEVRNKESGSQSGMENSSESTTGETESESDEDNSDENNSNEENSGENNSDEEGSGEDNSDEGDLGENNSGESSSNEDNSNGNNTDESINDNTGGDKENPQETTTIPEESVDSNDKSIEDDNGNI